MPTDQTQQVDHRAEALNWMAQDGTGPTDAHAHRKRNRQLLTALVHSNLAIAEDLQGIRRTLVAMHQGSPVDAVEASEKAALDA